MLNFFSTDRISCVTFQRQNKQASRGKILKQLGSTHLPLLHFNILHAELVALYDFILNNVKENFRTNVLMVGTILWGDWLLQYIFVILVL